MEVGVDKPQITFGFNLGFIVITTSSETEQELTPVVLKEISSNAKSFPVELVLLSIIEIEATELASEAQV